MSTKYKVPKKGSERHWTHELQKREKPELNDAHTSFNLGDHVQNLMTWDEYMEHVKKAHAEEFKKLTEAMPPSMRISPQLPQMVTPQAAWDEILFEAQRMDLYRCEFCGKEVHFEASACLYAGTVSGDLLEFSKANKNNWCLSPEDADNYVEQLSSGKIALTDSHGKDLKSYIGKVTGVEKVVANGKATKLKVKAKITDPEIDNIVKENHSGIGFSIEGDSQDMSCSICNHKLMNIMDRCEKHPDAPMMVRNLHIRKVSLTDNPAYKSKIESYEND